jgi:hypothetical protein
MNMDNSAARNSRAIRIILALVYAVIGVATSRFVMAPLFTSGEANEPAPMAYSTTPNVELAIYGLAMFLLFGSLACAVMLALSSKGRVIHFGIGLFFTATIFTGLMLLVY